MNISDQIEALKKQCAEIQAKCLEIIRVAKSTRERFPIRTPQERVLH